MGLPHHASGADPPFFIRGDRNFSSTHAVQQGLQNYGDQNLPHFSRVGSIFRLSPRLNWPVHGGPRSNYRVHTAA